MSNLNILLEILKRRGTTNFKETLGYVIKGRKPYFTNQKYQLIKSAMKKQKRLNLFSNEKYIGDYMEFGLFRGRAFLSALELNKSLNLNMNMYGFDSFEGLPEIQYKNDEKVFKAGQYACGQDTFIEIMNSWNIPENAYTLIPGFFDVSLSDEKNQHISSEKCAIAYIDCDLYESTVPVLDYLTPRLRNGSILIFDDWFSYAGNPHTGQIRAVREWLERTPHIKLLEFERLGNKISFFIQDWNNLD